MDMTYSSRNLPSCKVGLTTRRSNRQVAPFFCPKLSAGGECLCWTSVASVSLGFPARGESRELGYHGARSLLESGLFTEAGEYNILYSHKRESRLRLPMRCNTNEIQRPCPR